MERNQISTRTEYDRHPSIFSEVKSIIPNPKNILSFGCSYGLECKSIQEKYFPNVKQVGFDINKDVIQQNLKNNQYSNIDYIDNLDGLNYKFDLVFAMSVLCRWNSGDDLSYKFDTFNDTLKIIDQLVADNGYLCIVNSTYLFTDSQVASKYKVIETKHKWSGFVTKYDP